MSEAEALKIRTEAEVAAHREPAAEAEAFAQHPALLRLRELETLSDLERDANARLYIDFDEGLGASEKCCEVGCYRCGPATNCVVHASAFGV